MAERALEIENVINTYRMVRVMAGSANWTAISAAAVVVAIYLPRLHLLQRQVSGRWVTSGHFGVYMKRLLSTIGLLVVFAVTLSGCKRQPISYDDCVLNHIDQAETALAVTTIRNSCFAKYPVHFNWNEMAIKVGANTWSEVTQLTKFEELSEKQRRDAKQQYWEDVLSSVVRADLRYRAHDKFMLGK